MRIAAATLVLLLAGCGQVIEPSNGAASTNQIEKLSTPRVEEPDLQATVRLQPVTISDLDREGLVGAGCDFSRDGQILLATVGSDALVRLQGQLRHLIHSGPVGPTGGFFEDRHLSVSIGRTEEVANEADESAAWPARMTVTNRRTEQQQEVRGIWTCGS